MGLDKDGISCPACHSLVSSNCKPHACQVFDVVTMVCGFLVSSYWLYRVYPAPPAQAEPLEKLARLVAIVLLGFNVVRT